MKKAILTVIVVLLIAVFTCAAIYYFYFKPNEQIVPAFDEGKLSLVIEGEIIEAKEQPEVINEEVMLPIDTVKKYFDPNIWWDEKLGKVTVTTQDKVVRMKTDSLQALINNKPVTLKIPVVKKNNTVYIPIEFLSEFYNIELAYLKENNVVMIDYKNSIRRLADPISVKAAVRKGRSVRYPILKKLDPAANKPDENTLRIFEEYEKWYKVRTADGIIGYIEKKYVVVRWMMVKQMLEEKATSTAWKPEKGKINLVWEIVQGKGPDPSKISKMDGLDVVSPTWFEVIDTNGNLNNTANHKYVEWAHENGYKVWALVSNDFSNPGNTNKLLNNTDARDNIIKQILSYAALYKLDGINIDFENINKQDKDALTQFIRELTPFLKEQGLVVSMDVSVPDGSGNWSLCYDRKALGEIVDYVMLMAYDQHWATSPKAGSVAQLSWVETNIKKLIELVPREKLLLGIPFYNRLWKEEKNSDGKVKVSSPKALSMESAKKLIKENNAQTRWDEESGQFYAEYQKDNAIYKIWLEDENSISLKSSLVQKYRLAGAAAWRRNLELPAVWQVLNDNLKTTESYQAWQEKNKERTYVFN